MLAKVVAWGEDRGQALARLATALAATEILGVTTNVGFLRRLVEHPDVVAGRLDTELVERLAGDLVGPPATGEVAAAAAQLAGLLAAPAGPVVDPWDLADGWRLTGPAQQASQWRVAGQVVEVVVAPGGARLDGPAVVIDDDHRYEWAVDGETFWLGSGGDTWALTRLRETIGRSGPAGSGAGPVTSPMPGTVLAVYVEAGQTVHAGQALVAVEAMKMEHVVVAPVDGVVGEVSVEAGDAVRIDQPLATVVTPGADA
jgi:acetyl-CoA/propionyl-CoA carboxylase biotin carboxyl carrier protein